MIDANETDDGMESVQLMLTQLPDMYKPYFEGAEKMAKSLFDHYCNNGVDHADAAYASSAAVGGVLGKGGSAR